MISGVYFSIRISIMTAQGKFKPAPSPSEQWRLNPSKLKY